MKENVCICGGGSLGHVVAGYLASKEGVQVNVLTQRPCCWKKTLHIATPDQRVLQGNLNLVTDDPELALKDCTMVLLCLPGFAIREQLRRIKPWTGKGTFVGTVFSSTGFFFDAMEILDEDVPLWGFQRVPFIARTSQYGESANLLGYKNAHNIAVERCLAGREEFRARVEQMFDAPVHLLGNYFEASLTNSNPLLHTSRLYTMFGGENEGRAFPRMLLFYEEWTREAAQLLIDMDEEFFRLLDVLPVSKGYLPRILDYYESHDAESLARKLSSIQGFKGITSPMVETDRGWEPDFKSRYFTEDFPYGLHYIWKLVHEKGIHAPNIDKVYEWGMGKVNPQK